MSRRHARRLLDKHRLLVAHAVARQIGVAVPRYRSVDEIALAGNVAAVLEVVSALLATRDPRTVARAMDLLRALHRRRGFGAGEFMAAVLCALPVLRRFFTKYAATREEGLVLYERVEGILIPLYGRLASLLQEDFSDAEPTDVDAASPQAATAPAETDQGALPFEVVSVEELAQLKEVQTRIRQERDHLARELEAMQAAVERALRERGETDHR